MDSRVGKWDDDHTEDPDGAIAKARSKSAGAGLIGPAPDVE